MGRISVIANDIDESVPGLDKIHAYKKLHTVCDTMKSFFDKKYHLGLEGGELADDKEMEFSGCLIDIHDYYNEGMIDKEKLVETNKRASELIEKKISDAIKKGNKPLVVGGSHGASYNTVKAIKNHFPEDIGLLYFDSHNDCESYCKIPSGSVDRCSWVKKIVEDKLVKPENIIFVNGGPIPEENPCNKVGSKQLNKTVKTVINPDQNDEYYNEAETLISNLSKNVNRDFNKKEGVAYDTYIFFPAHTENIDNKFELEMIKENGLDIIGSDIQEYFPPAEISNVGIFGAYPKSRTDLKYNILDMKKYLNKDQFNKIK